MAIDIPPGYEIDSQDSNRIEIKDLKTGYIKPYWIGPSRFNENSISLELLDDETTVRPWYYFSQVAELPWYGLVVTGDLNHSGISEIYGFAYPIVTLDTLLSEWNFAQINMGSAYGMPLFGGDTNNNGLMELLAIEDSSINLYESEGYYDYPPARLIYTVYDDCHCLREEKLGDLDNDGLGEIVLYYGQRAYGYQIYEYDGDSSYVWKTAIRFFDHVNDYTGEPSWGDIDGDGRTEVFAGGIHGEVIMYENVADDSFEFVWQDSAGAPNAYSTEYLGDTDGDGLNEFMVAGSDIWGYGGMVYSIYEATGGDNEFDLVWRQGFDGYWASDGDILVGDFTGNGNREIALCTGRNIAIIKAFGNNDWRVITRYRNAVLDLEIYPYKVNFQYNDFLLNLVRGARWRTRMLAVAGNFLPGDANYGGKVNGLDVVYLVNFLKGRIQSLPAPFGRGDTNGDCTVNFLDVAYLVNYIKGVGHPPEPGWCSDDLDG